jgi:hypothetical protein
MKNLFLAVLIVFSALFNVACDRGTSASHDAVQGTPSSQASNSATQINGQTNGETVQSLYARRAKDVPVHDKGFVAKLLADDSNGSRHQRFLVKVATGQTLLFAHNLDLAARVEPLAIGDEIEFQGEYVYNPKGGIVHWTHQDPQGRHAAGWIRHSGHLYQ